MAKANVVEHGYKNKKNKKPDPKGEVSKKQTKFQGKCFNCDKMSHKAFDYRLLKKKARGKCGGKHHSKYF